MISKYSFGISTDVLAQISYLAVVPGIFFLNMILTELNNFQQSANLFAEIYSNKAVRFFEVENPYGATS